MNDSGATKTQRKRGRRWVVRVVFVLAGLVLVLWFFRERIAAFALRRAARGAGIEVAWRALELDGLRRVRILDVSARRTGDLDLAADRIEIDLDLLLLVRGDLGGLERVEVDRLRGCAGPFRGAGGGTRSQASWRMPSALPHLAVTTPGFELRLSEHRRVVVTDLALVFDGVNARCTALSLAWNDRDKSTAFPLDVRGSYNRGRFEIERAVWDPRIVLESARIDLDEAQAGLVTFAGGVLCFGGRAAVQGRLDEGVAHVTGSVSQLDVGAIARAYASDLARQAAGVVDARWTASIPLADPLALECSAGLLARDAHFVRSVDELSCRIQATPRGIEITDGLVAHGDNAIRFEGRAPPLGTEACAWLGRLSVFCEGVVGDPRSLMAVDVGLPLRADAPWTNSPVYATAVLANGDVAGHARAPAAELGAIVSAFAGTSPAEGRVDFEADVKLSVFDASRVSVAGVVVAVDARVLGHAVDTFVAEVGWNRTGLSFQDVSAAAGANRVDVGSLRVPRAVFGACAADRLREVTVSRLRAELNDLPVILSALETGPAFERLSAHRLVFEGALAGGEIALERAQLTTRAGVGRIERGRIPLLGNVAAILHDPALDLESTVRFDDVAEVVAALAPNAFPPDELPRGSVAGSARVRGHPNGPTAGLVLSARDLSVRGLRFDEVDVRADLDERSLWIEKADSRGTLGVFTLSGSYVFAEERIVDGRLEADLVDLSRLAPERLPSGAVQVEAHANGTLGAVDGTLSIAARDLFWKGVRVDELAIEARAVSGEWIVEKARAGGHGLQATLSGRVSSLAPSAATRRIDLETLTIAALDASAELTRPATIVQDGSSWTVDRLVLDGSAGKADLMFEQDGAESKLDVGLSMPLPRETLALVGIESGGGVVEASIALTRLGRELTCETQGKIATVDDPTTAPTRVEWNAALRERRLTIEQLSIERGAGEGRIHASATGSFPLDPLGDEFLTAGPLELRVDLDTPDLSLLPFVRPAWVVSGGARLTADLGGTWSAVTGSLDVNVDGAAASGVRGLAELGRVTGSARLAFDESTRLDAADFSIDGTVALRAAGSIDSPLDVRALAQGNLEHITHAPVDLAVRVDADDLGPLAERLPALRRTRGRMHADLRVGGTLIEPTFVGEGTLDDGEIRTTTNLPSIVGVTSRVHFDGTHLVIDTFTGEMGGAPFTMEGRVEVIGEVPAIDLKLKGSSLLLWRERDVTVRADADLALLGPLDALTLSGTLALRDGRYTKKFDFLALGKRGPKSAGSRGLRLFSLDEPPFSTMRFDVKVTTATPFTIASNLVRGRLSPSLELLGTGALPELRGSVLVEPSRVLLPSGALKIRSGRIEFRPDRPDVPDLDIQGSARMQGYDIAINVSGSYDDPRIELSSVPPLPREDLALLLITGRPPGNSLSGAAGQRAALDIAVYIARDVAVAWFEADEEDVDSLAERLEVVVGADTTKSGADALLVRMRLAGDLPTDRRAIFATGERDIYDFYNFGVRFVFAFK